MQNKRFNNDNDLRHWSKLKNKRNDRFYDSLSLIVGVGTIFTILILIALFTV